MRFKTKMRSRTMPHQDDEDGLYYDVEEDATAADLPQQRWVWATRLGVTTAVIVAVVLVANARRHGADEAPPPRMRAAAPDASGPHPHEWAPPNARIVHYIDLTRPPTPHQQQRLISRNKKVTASVRGNLGEASVITNGKRDDWLKDRWQAAENMQGAPTPGPHWLLVELEQKCVVERIDVEFESAYARDYALKGRTRDGGWVTLAVGVSAVESRPAKQRVLHRLASQAMAPVDQVRLDIARPGTQWGTSVWELDVFGTCTG